MAPGVVAACVFFGIAFILFVVGIIMMSRADGPMDTYGIIVIFFAIVALIIGGIIIGYHFSGVNVSRTSG